MLIIYIPLEYILSSETGTDIRELDISTEPSLLPEKSYAVILLTSLVAFTVISFDVDETITPVRESILTSENDILDSELLSEEMDFFAGMIVWGE